MRPLYEQAYAQLGLDPEAFDNAVIRMLDHVLQTPEIDGPVALTRKSVMYQYADPQLEQLSPGAETIAADGLDNLRRIKEQASALRRGLLAQPMKKPRRGVATGLLHQARCERGRFSAPAAPACWAWPRPFLGVRQGLFISVMHGHTPPASGVQPEEHLPVFRQFIRRK